jgi:hypothetical protein
MQSKAPTVDTYLASLPAERRATVQAVREVILRSKDPQLAEGMQYGMIGYFVPHSLFPAGYHCDPKQPLPFAGLAAQKNAYSLYLMGLYVGAEPDGDTDHARWLREAWAKSGKKLDMGKACIRFKKLEDLPLDVLAQAFKRMTVKQYIRAYEHGLGTFGTANATRAKKKAPAKKASTKPAKTVKKAAKKAAAKPRSARA